MVKKGFKVGKPIVRSLAEIKAKVNALSKKGNNKSRTKAKGKGGMSHGGSEHHARHHYIAHAAPFSEAASGAKQLSQFPLGTTTYDATCLADATSNASGVFSCVITAHPFYSFYMPASGGSVSGTSALSLFGAGGSGWTVTSGVSDGTFKSQCERYRLVSIGIRFKPTTSFTNTTGHGYVATIPGPDQLPVVCTLTTGANFADYLGVPFDTGTLTVSSSLANLPGSRQFTFAEMLADGGIQIRLGPCGPRHEDWLSPDWESGKQGLAQTTTNQTTFNGTIDPSFSSHAGWEMALIRFSGCPNSTQIGTFQVKYHFEVVPKLANTNGSNTPMPTGMPAPVTSSPDLKHKVLAQVAQLPKVEAVKTAMKREVATMETSALGKLRKIKPSSIKGLAEMAMGLAI